MFPESRFNSTVEWKLWGGTKSYSVWQESFMHLVALILMERMLKHFNTFSHFEYFLLNMPPLKADHYLDVSYEQI
jgi:hypothetical protein